MKSLRLLISGRVQGVGFRDWLEREATHLRLSGWVRNTNSGMVEAIICGPDDIVDQCVKLCWQGPVSAQVNAVSITDAPPPVEPGFMRRATR